MNLNFKKLKNIIEIGKKSKGKILKMFKSKSTNKHI